jgi:hypothetical protein
MQSRLIMYDTPARLMKHERRCPDRPGRASCYFRKPASQPDLKTTQVHASTPRCILSQACSLHTSQLYVGAGVGLMPCPRPRVVGLGVALSRKTLRLNNKCQVVRGVPAHAHTSRAVFRTGESVLTSMLCCTQNQMCIPTHNQMNVER